MSTYGNMLRTLMVLGVVLLALPVFAVETITTNVVMPTFGTTQVACSGNGDYTLDVGATRVYEFNTTSGPDQIITVEKTNVNHPNITVEVREQIQRYNTNTNLVDGYAAEKAWTDVPLENDPEFITWDAGTVNVQSHYRLRKDVDVAPDNDTANKVTAASANF